MHEYGTEEKKNSRDRSGLDAPKWLQPEIDAGMKKGWTFGDDDERYAFAKDAIFDLFGDDVVNAEMIEQAIKHAEKKGLKFKYDKIADAYKAGWKVEDSVKQKFNL
jgi:hypothetical protein